MIQFYNKYILFFLPLSLLPLILHLLFFKKTKKVKFTYINLIERILIQNFPKKKIVDIIILTLRCLIIFLLILYFARPVMYINPNKQSFNLIIAIDSSFSTRQRVLNTTKFEIVKEKVKNLLKFLKNKNIKIKLLLFDEDVRIINENFELLSEELIEKIDKIRPSYKNTNIKVLFNYIGSLIKFDTKEKYFKMIIFTDLAEHILKDKNVQFIDNKMLEEILFCYPEIVSTNIGVESLYTEKKNDEVIINCLPFASGKEIKNFNAKLFVNFQQVDVVNVNIEKKKFVFNYIFDKGPLLGKIVIPSDSLIEDNEFYFVQNERFFNKEIFCFIDEPIYYRGFKSKKFYFEKLSIPEVNLNIIYSDESKKDIDFENKDFIIVDKNTISGFVKNLSSDNKLAIFPTEEINYEDYENFLKEIEIIELQKNNLNSYNIMLGDDESFNEYINKFDYKKIWIKNKFLINVYKDSYWITLLRFNDGTPALVKKNNIFLFTFPIDHNNTNFLYKPIFIGLMKYIFVEEQKKLYKNYYFISEIIPVEDKIVRIKNLTQENIPEDLYRYEGDTITFYFPGIYEIVYSNKEKFYIAINTKPEEGEISLIEKNKIKEYLKNINVSFLNVQKDSYEKEVYSWCFGKEYSQSLLYIIILFFIIETLLSRILYKKLI